MTKIEMLDKLALIREAVAELPDGATMLSVSIGDPSWYIQISSLGETLEATSVAEVEDDDGPYKEYRTEVLGIPVIWLEI